MMAVVSQLGIDFLCGLRDSLSGWYVAVKCWRQEARKVRDKPAPPKAFTEFAKNKNVEVKASSGVKATSQEGTLIGILWNTIFTTGVALLITFLIQSVCSIIASLFGDHIQRGLAVSSIVLHFLWWVPSMAVIKLTSIINNNEVADKVYMHKYGSPKYSPLSTTIGEFVVSSVYQCVFLVQASIVVMLTPWPIMALTLEWFHYSLFYGLYAFEYKWALLGLPGHVRVAQIENNWPYYFAFGLPIHLAVEIWSSLYIRTMAFTLLFPFCILGATAAAPPQTQFVFPIHIMYPSIYVTNQLYKLMGQSKPKMTSNAQGSRSTPSR